VQESEPASNAAPREGGSPGTSFLGTAAATAAGVLGGALLMNSMRGLFGGQQGQAHGALNSAGQGGAPWAPNAGSGDLARQAGIDDIGRGGGAAAQGGGEAQRQGLFDVAQNDSDTEHSDEGEFEDDLDFGDDSDTA
jgi:hypothetical protein